MALSFVGAEAGIGIVGVPLRSPASSPEVNGTKMRTDSLRPAIVVRASSRKR